MPPTVPDARDLYDLLAINRSLQEMVAERDRIKRERVDALQARIDSTTNTLHAAMRQLVGEKRLEPDVPYLLDGQLVTLKLKERRVHASPEVDYTLAVVQPVTVGG